LSLLRTGQKKADRALIIWISRSPGALRLRLLMGMRRAEVAGGGDACGPVDSRPARDQQGYRL
jgi:hypothetical protein